MGCLHHNSNFPHWFGNIHFSGPCNRKCYFCIGQHMMGLDSYNNLHTRYLTRFDEFMTKCKEKNCTEINLTGTNTDPMLYEHLDTMICRIKGAGFKVGIRTNGINLFSKIDTWNRFDKGSISIPSFDPEVYKKMMGHGDPPDIHRIVKQTKFKNLKVNICLSKFNVFDLMRTLLNLSCAGIERVNVRELYGQPNYGNPFLALEELKQTLGMPTYKIFGMEVTYWDVHFVEVESVNLYASGKISLNYPITKGYDDTLGLVEAQSEFGFAGRVREQWI